MAKFRSIKNSFIAGEFGPNAMGRTDIAAYNHASKKLRNVLPYLSGGVYKRPGSLLEYDTNSKVSVVVPFVGSSQDAYVHIVDVDKNTVSHKISYTDSVDTTSVDTNDAPYFGNFDNRLQIADTLFVVNENYKPQKLIQQGIFYKTGLEEFRWRDFDYGLSGAQLRDAWPYQKKNTSGWRVKVTNNAGDIVIVAESAKLLDSAVGGMIKIHSVADPNIMACYKIIDKVKFTDFEYEAETVVALPAGEIGVYPAGTFLPSWWQTSWSTILGWPRTIAYHANRLIYGGNRNEADSIWCSQSDNIYVMSTPFYSGTSTIDFPTSDPVGEQPFQITMAAPQFESISWLTPQSGDLLLGTTGTEYAIVNGSGGFVCGTSDGGTLAGVQVRVRGSNGSGYMPVQKTGGSIFYVNPSFNEIRMITYSDEAQSFQSESVQLMSDHFPKANTTGYSKISKFRWDNSRHVLWCLDYAGNLFGINFDRKLQTMGLYPMSMGEDAFVLDFDVVRNPLSNLYEVVVVTSSASGIFVSRIVSEQFRLDSAYTTVNSALFFQNPMFTPSMFTDYSIVSYTSSPYTDKARTIAHLPNTNIVGMIRNAQGIFYVTGITTDGSGDFTVPNGIPGHDSIDSVEVWGVPYTAIVEPVRIDAGSQIGTAQGAIKRIHHATIRMSKTLNAKIGRDDSNLEEIVFRTGSTPINKSAELFTGDKLVVVDSDYDRDGYLTIQSDKPLPFSVISIIAEGVTND